MAIKYSRAIWVPLGPQTEPRMTGHDIVCLHTMVGYLYGTRNMFLKGGYSGTESHFGIGGKWGFDVTGGRNYDGRVEQWQDLAYTADANLDGNHHVISIETADNAPAKAADIQRWTPNQVSEIKKLLKWLCSKSAHALCPASWACHSVGIPIALIPDTKPGRRGIAYHAQGIPPNLVKGGERWSNVTGKECPGPKRIAQLTREIIPQVREEVFEVVTSAQVTAATLKALKTNIALNDNGATPTVPTISVADGLRMTDRKLDELRALTKALTKALADVAETLDILSATLLPAASLEVIPSEESPERE